MLMQARAQQLHLSFVTSSDNAREQMAEVFAETDTRLPPLERNLLGARGSVFAETESDWVIRAPVCRGVAGGVVS